MTVIKNITEGLVFAETPNGLKGLQPEETLAVSECLNYATLLEAGFVVALAEDEEVVKEENSEEANKEQGSEVIKDEVVKTKKAQAKKNK